MVDTFLIYKNFLLNSDLFLENTYYFLYSILLPVSFSLYIFYFKKNNFEIKEILYLIIIIFIFYFTSLVMYFSFNLLFFHYENFCASNAVQFVYLNSLIPSFSIFSLPLLWFFWISSLFCLVLFSFSSSFSIYSMVLRIFIPTFILYVHFYISYKWFDTKLDNDVFDNFFIKWTKTYDYTFCKERMLKVLPLDLDDSSSFFIDDFIVEYKEFIYSNPSANTLIDFFTNFVVKKKLELEKTIPVEKTYFDIISANSDYLLLISFILAGISFSLFAFYFQSPISEINSIRREITYTLNNIEQYKIELKELIKVLHIIKERDSLSNEGVNTIFRQNEKIFIDRAIQLHSYYEGFGFALDDVIVQSIYSQIPAAMVMVNSIII